MTTLLYLDNTYLFNAQAQVKEIRISPEGLTIIILDQTLFYPQGGGQPCDTGTITSQQAEFKVSHVRLDEHGTVHHTGSFAHGSFSTGDFVTLTIDKDRRITNAKLHSAGHLLDCAITELGLAFKPLKGYHFQDHPYVEYEGNLDHSPETIQALQDKINELLQANKTISTHELPYEDALAQGITAPIGKNARLVTIDGFKPCGCGGTHVHRTSDIGSLAVRKIKSKGGNTRVSYEIIDKP